MKSVQTYDVAGMTCDHCARAVGNEIRKIGGVESVTVDLVNGMVTVTSDAGLSTVDVSSAVTEAGYELIG